MKIIEITALENGAHRNQTGNFSAVPSGWAVIRDNDALQNFPFGSFKVEEINGITYMVNGSWIAGELPKPEPEPEPEPTLEDVTLDLMAEHEERICMLELMA